MGRGALGFDGQLKPGHVVVTDVGSTDQVGLWGSENTLRLVKAGAVGIVTNGECRDTAEIVMQKTPVCAFRRGRTIIPGRIMAVETQTRIGIGGAQVEPGDIVGADDDGLVVVPQEVAMQVAIHARAVLLADMKSRSGHYKSLGMAERRNRGLRRRRALLRGARQESRLTQKREEPMRITRRSLMGGVAGAALASTTHPSMRAPTRRSSCSSGKGTACRRRPPRST